MSEKDSEPDIEARRFNVPGGFARFSQLAPQKGHPFPGIVDEFSEHIGVVNSRGSEYRIALHHLAVILGALFAQRCRGGLAGRPSLSLLLTRCSPSAAPLSARPIRRTQRENL